MAASRAFPGFDALYELRDPLSDPPYRGIFEADLDTALALTRGELQSHAPITVRHEMGRGRPGDVTWTTLAIPVVVSLRVVDLLSDNAFTGWSTYPVHVLDREGQVIDGYYGLAITGRCGPIEPSQSEVVFRDLPGGRVPALKGMFFDPASWDGSDLFMSVEQNALRFVREDVKSALEIAKVRNLRFERVSEVEWE